jgi:hypothetical protein
VEYRRFLGSMMTAQLTGGIKMAARGHIPKRKPKPKKPRENKYPVAPSIPRREPEFMKTIIVKGGAHGE